MDYDYWKRQYQETWDQSSAREELIAKYLSDESGKAISSVGLGAGSTDFLSGPASNHGHQKGDADLVVDGTNVYLEVTGPLVTTIPKDADLWVRPDKVRNAVENRHKHRTWLVHHLPKNNLIRAIPFGAEFREALSSGAFRVIEPRIRNVQERYYSIPATHSCVKNIEVLISFLKKLKIEKQQ